MTREDYRQLLVDYEEIEDLTCPICMEKMELDQFVVKTMCGGGTGEVGGRAPDRARHSRDGQDQSSDTTNEVIRHRQDNLLKGHKFHRICFQKWLNIERDRLQDPDEIFHRCPLCRQDVMSRHDPGASGCQSTVVGSNQLASSGHARDRSQRVASSATQSAPRADRHGRPAGASKIGHSRTQPEILQRRMHEQMLAKNDTMLQHLSTIQRRRRQQHLTEQLQGGPVPSQAQGTQPPA